MLSRRATLTRVPQRGHSKGGSLNLFQSLRSKQGILQKTPLELFQPCARHYNPLPQSTSTSNLPKSTTYKGDYSKDFINTMIPSTITQAPRLDSFTPLAEYQSQTPASFTTTIPVLHYHASGINASISEIPSPSIPIFSSPGSEVTGSIASVVDVFVTSE